MFLRCEAALIRLYTGGLFHDSEREAKPAPTSLHILPLFPSNLRLWGLDFDLSRRERFRRDGVEGRRGADGGEGEGSTMSEATPGCVEEGQVYLCRRQRW